MGEPTNTATDAPGGFQISVQPILEGAENEEFIGKYTISTGLQVPEVSQPGAEVGELPRTYGEPSVYLVAQDPHRLFTYWDLDVTAHPGGPAVIRCHRVDEKKLEVEFEVPFEARNWYIPVSGSGGTYQVEIGYYRAGQWHSIAMSGTATTPRTEISPDDSFSFATLPLDAAFSAILASLPPRMRHHPELMRHLAELQARHAAGKNGGPLPGLQANEQAMALLKALLGDQLLLALLSGTLDTASLSSAITARLAEIASSESASALLTRFQQAAAESSLFSGIVQFPTVSSETLSSQAFSSEVLSSWTESLLSWSQAVRHAAASEWLASWGLRPGEFSAERAESSAAISSAALSSMEFSREFSAAQAAASWFSLFAASWPGAAERSSWMTAAAAARGEFPTSWGAAEISSWQSLASWSQAIGASWFGAQLASWSAAAISSWTQEVLSSWFRETFSSWNVETLSSWFRESLASWSAETLSSWTSETLSSWARSELAALSSGELASWAVPPAAREFFMNVNAEVIFYGGTDPRARVTIAGQPIQLNPDGTFRYHFLFPNNRYEIPIVAVSPDGVETRSAILRFERQTQKSGKVDDTPQPPLGEPMGKQ